MAQMEVTGPEGPFTCAISKLEAYSQSALSTLTWGRGAQLPGQWLGGWDFQVLCGSLCCREKLAGVWGWEWPVAWVWPLMP